MCTCQALVAEQESKDSGGASIAEQVLSIMEIILDEANAETLSEDKVSYILCCIRRDLLGQWSFPICCGWNLFIYLFLSMYCNCALIHVVEQPALDG